MPGSSYSDTAEWEAFHLHQKETKYLLAKYQNQNPPKPPKALIIGLSYWIYNWPSSK